MTSTIQVTRLHEPEPPPDIYVPGNPPTEQAIVNQLLSVSLSSPHIGSYNVSIDPGKGEGGET